jgi:hypothetical protein
MEIRVAYVNTERGGGASKQNVAIDSFVTGKQIRLGMLEAEVTAILGTPRRHHSKGRFRTIEYEVSPRDKSRFLAHYNVPEYYGIYTFRAGRLVAFQFGFPYP